MVSLSDTFLAPFTISEFLPSIGRTDFKKFELSDSMPFNFTFLGTFMKFMKERPYVCGEWENGGLPYWLLKSLGPNSLQRTSNDPKWLAAVSKWFDKLLPIVKPTLRVNGGPVLMVQIENEYGSYQPADRNYTIWLRDLVRQYLGDQVVFYTTDGGSDSYLKNGVIPDVFPTVDFGPGTETSIVNSFNAQRDYAPRVMYNLNASFNFYMVITSYDYDAPISEAGDVTEKYLAIRDWIASLPDWTVPQIPVPPNTPKKAYSFARMYKMADLVDGLDSGCIYSERPVDFEWVDQPFGFVAYTTGTLTNFLNGLHKNRTALPHCNPGTKLTGILGDVLIDGRRQENWEHCKIDITKIPSSGTPSGNRAGWYRGTLMINDATPSDTFVDTTGWGKGVITVNGHILGKYWASQGPQMTLYVPAPFLKSGQNEVVLLELDATLPSCSGSFSICELDFKDKPIFNFQNQFNSMTRKRNDRTRAV
ncbi:hypothetical protein WR25_12171 [Diploscapter pachys]|uniref:Beta-galactosidase n=1 Tax=Diploscapter pachys TaxID=2018661 RepID=A0A2A2KVV2_9BILA|nr:hypothetical protein WR25_12171 [Diploscapter pachys]